jgi:hypothetical protein
LKRIDMPEACPQCGTFLSVGCDCPLGDGERIDAGLEMQRMDPDDDFEDLTQYGMSVRLSAPDDPHRGTGF